ncbi:addiction module protein [Microcystis elabens FACHB-917]|nr:addiction module protein [Microcystis elabens FACHB-917]
MGSDLLNLPLAQRLELVQALWDSIAAEQQGLPATRAEQQLVDKRLEAFRLDGNPGDDAFKVLAELEQAL